MSKIKSFLRRLLFIVLLLVIAGYGTYLLFAYFFVYSDGQTVGVVQKISQKGWVCKTWEGEQIRALTESPTVPEKFFFSVRDDAIAEQIKAHLGKKVVLSYEQHQGLPSCFGDSAYFVKSVELAP